MYAAKTYLQRKEDIPPMDTCLNAGCEQQFDMTIVEDILFVIYGSSDSLIT
ncbi:hypothetical protein PIL02S_03587 [Paenibacillus illinoisensis]|uniref:Uncharacterized protein n=1 Tax=Paenibacillus illinoisensis TaxID=59845 RepID=A0A2W0C7J3_9BACL|nr:hypothetical protein PIL02S_03587 [Paenibacillus illinoisensis]